LNPLYDSLNCSIISSGCIVRAGITTFLRMPDEVCAISAEEIASAQAMLNKNAAGVVGAPANAAVHRYFPGLRQFADTRPQLPEGNVD